MKKCCSYILMVVCMIICRQEAFGQKDSLELITADLNGASIDQFVLALEKQTNLHFYYDAAQFDSITFNINVKKQPLIKVLEQAFAKTDFQFSIADPDYAFITKGKRINTELPD